MKIYTILYPQLNQKNNEKKYKLSLIERSLGNFYVCTDKDYYKEIINNIDYPKTKIIEMEISSDFIKKYPLIQSGYENYMVYNIPAKDLDIFNENIIDIKPL